MEDGSDFSCDLISQVRQERLRENGYFVLIFLPFRDGLVTFLFLLSLLLLGDFVL